ncbi:MAG: CDP-alcohol phosphatidyltransferase family protein [bacterium]
MDYNYSTTVKSSLSDELINTYLLRPIAGLVVRALYHTPVTPNQVTLISTFVGVVAAALYFPREASWTAIAGLCVTVKDILDSADGQLARAKQQYSRRGRFLDSIGDFLVNACLFGVFGYILFQQFHTLEVLVLSLLGFWGITLRVSYHVFYQAFYLHLEKKYEVNRVTETITDEDRKGDTVTYLLQRTFQFLYGWQDRLMIRVDYWCRSGSDASEYLHGWYSNPIGLRLSGLIGIGTELFLLMLFSLFNQIRLYLYVNLFLMNGILLISILYRKFFLHRSLLSRGQ